MMGIDEMLDALNAGPGTMTDEMLDASFRQSQEAFRVTMKLNNSYHNPEEVVMVFGELTGSRPGEGFCLFPPFYTDFGRNIHVGERVFINASCHFQDQGGIYIGNDVLIGHRVMLATIDHDLNPYDRSDPARSRLLPLRLWEHTDGQPDKCDTTGIVTGNKHYPIL